MKNFSTKEKRNTIYAAVFLVVAIIIFAGILIFYKGGKEPVLPVESPQKEVPKEKTEEEIIHDLSVPVPGFQETEITKEIMESLAIPAKDFSGGENGDQFLEEKIIESLTKPIKQ